MPQQRPKKQENVEGRIVIARNIRWSLPTHIRNAIESPFAQDRLTALEGLAHLHRVGNDRVQTEVINQTRRLIDDDSKMVSTAAMKFLTALNPEQAPRKTEEPAQPEAQEQPQRNTEEQTWKADEQSWRNAVEQTQRKAEEQPQWEADEQARRNAEEQTWLAEDQARREADEQAWHNALEQTKRRVEEQMKQIERETDGQKEVMTPMVILAILIIAFLIVTIIVFALVPPL